MIFMMLPQTLPTGAQIEVKYTDVLTNTPRTLTTFIAGSIWTMGKTVTYRISTSSIVMASTLEVTGPEEYLYKGGRKTYTVKSYASVSGGGSTTNVPIAWEAEFSEDGEVNWSANSPAWLTDFTKEGSGNTVLTPFINYLGNSITDPYIYNDPDCRPYGCKLIWQGEKDLMTDVALSADQAYSEFSVNRTTIHQGNAVVAVYNSHNIVMWSWYIWVTDYKLGMGLKIITNFQHHNYKLMPVNLGWCDVREVIYAERSVQVRFIQKPTAGYTPAATKTFTLKQKEYKPKEVGNT
ncbi:hypothetical protein [Phocaeicola abscessus]|uniref:hypothetical protein n=1 Tax=Phocaeicola abscessus TaxID=555313 RepID=UPI0004B1AC18|nr:hypothetical protein [Phocaeicola abscessus]